MKTGIKFNIFVAGTCLAVCANLSFAADSALDLSLPVAKQEAKFFMLASSENGASATDKAVAKAIAAPAPEYDAPLWSGSNVHKYLGLATVGAALATMMSSPGEGCEHNCSAQPQAPRDVNGTHAMFAKTTAALAVATVATGLITHWDDFALEDGWTDPDNLHVLLGTAGAALLGYATMLSANSSTPVSHAGIAEVGALGMAVAIGLTW